MRPYVILLALAVLGGCGNPVSGYFAADPGRAMSQSGPPLPAAATPAADPVALFAATAVPGQPGTAGGQPARLGRVYYAGSGRECREVLLGGGLAERAQVACRQPDGSFASTRPLLQGAGLQAGR